tara:strand:+ start:11540 stop:13039 length:1500 start_codon:yes stop_codon:yes gene_type:complete
MILLPRYIKLLFTLLPLFFFFNISIGAPNIVLMLSDDQGWDGLSVQMHPDVDSSKSDLYYTPRLEELAAQGMRFSAFYSPSSVCAPTRISLQTGISPAKNKWTKAAPTITAERNFPMVPIPHRRAILEDEITIGEVLQSKGYMTAHYGKWHISGGGPELHGYTESDGDTSNGNAYDITSSDNPLDVYGMSQRALDFMKRSSEEGRPFFIQISYYPLHEQQEASPLTIKKVKQRPIGLIHHDYLVAAITEDLDSGVGVILDGIEELNLSDNTYIIYMGDNGQRAYEHNSNCSFTEVCINREEHAALTGAKGNVSEGGIRVPFIIKGPGINKNSWSHTQAVGYDLFPTFAEWAGIDKQELPKNIEGGSIASILENNGIGEINRIKEELVFHFPHYQDGSPQSAIFLDDYKLIKYYEINKTVLFNIVEDIGEKNNLISTFPNKAAELEIILDTYLKSINADIPAINTSYDFSKPRTPSINRNGNKVYYNPMIELNRIYYPRN